jgi:Kef-type K+ transport system membrane component KefB
MRSNELLNLTIVLIAGFVAPILHYVIRRTRVPAVVIEIIVGMIIGPDVLHWVRADETVKVVSMIGLSVLLYLAGNEIDVRSLRGRVGRQALIGFAGSMVLALLVGVLLDTLGVVNQPLLVAVIFTATSLGIVAPVLRDSMNSATPTGQFILASAAIGDGAAIVLLSLLFSKDTASSATRGVLLGSFVVIVVAVAWIGSRRTRLMPLGRILQRLQDTNAQIRVRGTMVIVLSFAVLANRLGLEAILGAFVAGVLISALDGNAEEAHPLLKVKLDAIAFGFLVPVFFVTSGITFDLASLVDKPSRLAPVPIFVLALLVVRGLPALGFYKTLGWRSAAASSLLLATSLPFIVAATQIGVAAGTLSPSIAAAMVAAGLISALVFPVISSALLARDAQRVESQSETADVTL